MLLRKWKMAVAALLLTGAIVSCSDSDSGSNPVIPPPAPGGNTVSVRDDSFSPASLTVSRGTLVTWTWNANNTHTVTSGSPGGGNAGQLFDSPVQSGGQFQFTFNQAGTYPYFCRVHGSMMTGTISVQ